MVGREGGRERDRVVGRGRVVGREGGGGVVGRER